MLVTFIDIKGFFIRQKAEQLREKDMNLSTFNKYVIAWTMVLLVLNFSHSLGNIAYNPLFKYYSILSDNFGYEFFSEFFAEIYVPFVDFLTGLTLLYLFYF
jgi:hypothetical protein